MAEGSEKRSSQYTRNSATGSSPFDAERAWPADEVLEQLEGDAVADCEGIERRPLLHIAAVEKHLATACRPNETVTLADE